MQCATALPSLERGFPYSQPPPFLGRCARVRHYASPSGTATASGYPAGSGGEFNKDFPDNSKYYAISRNEIFMAEQIHPRTRQTTMWAHDRILSDGHKVCCLKARIKPRSFGPIVIRFEESLKPFVYKWSIKHYCVVYIYI